MKYVFPLLFLLMGARTQAQYYFAIVQDPKDAQVNVRKGIICSTPFFMPHR